MCRPVEHAYWMLFQPHLGVSPSRPLTEMCEQMHLTVLSVTLLSVTEFSFQRRKTAPLESLERDASVWQQVGPLHSCKCCDTLLCKCQSHPIKWLSDAIAHKGIPPMKFFVIGFVSRFSLSQTRMLFIDAPAIHSERGKTRELLQCHVSCRSTLMLCLWFSWVMSVLVIHLQAVWTTYTLAIFTTMSVCSLQLTSLWLLVALLVKHLHYLSRLKIFMWMFKSNQQ